MVSRSRYALYDKIYLPSGFREVYSRCRKKNVAPGIDGKIFDVIEAAGVGEFLKGIEQELKEQKYKPNMVKRVYIPKSNGKMRPLKNPDDKRSGSANGVQDDHRTGIRGQ